MLRIFTHDYSESETLPVDRRRSMHVVERRYGEVLLNMPSSFAQVTWLLRAIDRCDRTRKHNDVFNKCKTGDDRR